MRWTMSRWERFVFHKSRDRAWLLAAVAMIFTIGVLGGAVAERLWMPEPDPPGAGETLPSLPFGLGGFGGGVGGLPNSMAYTVLTATLSQDPVAVPDVFDTIAVWAADVEDGEQSELRSVLAAAHLDESERELAGFALDAMWGKGGELPTELVARADAEPLVRHANYVVGTIRYAWDDTAGAIAAFEREAAEPLAIDARQWVVDLAREARDAARLQSIIEDPIYTDVVDAGVRLDAAILQRDWLRVLLLIMPSQYEHVEASLVVLACLAGLCWFALIVQMSQPDDIWSMRVLLCSTAFILGVLSTTATVFVVIWQEEILGFVQRDDLIGGLFFYIAGVGLREEAIKLLFFAPLLPVLLRRGNQLEMLIVAGCVGLGFAAEENVGYYHYGATNAPGRYVTANFFHIAATALCGLALCRAFLYRRQGPTLFVQTFIVVVMIHGLYDAVLSIPEIAEFSLAYLFCLAALAFWFFREVRELRRWRRDTLSPTGTFVIGIATLLSATLVVLASELGLTIAAMVMIPTAMEMALLVYLFLREMPGSLVSV